MNDLTPLAIVLYYLGQALLVAVAIPATWFPIRYRRSYWRETVTGRGLMRSSIALALAIDLTVLGAVLQVTPGSALLEVFLFLQVLVLGFLLATTTSSLRHLGRIQRANPDIPTRKGQNREELSPDPR